MTCKRLFKAIMIILMIQVLCLSGTAYAANNLLMNNDFHAADEDGLPSDWYTDAYILEPGYTIFSLREGDSEHPFAAEIHNIGDNADSRKIKKFIRFILT